MYVREQGDRVVVRVSDFFEEYMAEVRFDPTDSQFMCLVMRNAKFICPETNLPHGYQLKDRVCDVDRHDIGFQFLNLWRGEQEYSLQDNYKMNSSGIHWFINDVMYFRLAWRGLQEFRDTDQWMTEEQFEEYIREGGEVDLVSVNKDVKFQKLRNFMRVGMLKEILDKSPDAVIYLV